VFIKPKCFKSPINPLVPLLLKAREYPQKYHWKTMTEKEPIQAHIIERADFRRASPEYRNPRPGIMSKTMHDATMINAWSPDWYHWFRFVVAVEY
jgi:hypothetical protein